MKTHQTRTMKMLLSFRKKLWALLGCLLIHGAACTASADVWQDAAISHHCEGNDKIADAEVLKWAEAGCVECQSRQSLLAHQRLNHQSVSDAQVKEWSAKGCVVCQVKLPLVQHKAQDHDKLTETEIKEWAGKDCAECKKRLAVIKSHRCPSNAEIIQALPGTATHRELKKGYEQGCPRCKTNYLWWQKHHQ